jgi:hypothetical protein
MFERIFSWIDRHLPPWAIPLVVLPIAVIQLALAESPGWAIIKSSIRTKWIASSYIWIFIVPTVAHSLSNFNSDISVPIGDQEYRLRISLPFSWMAFYYGAVFFAVGSGIYALFCPPLIRRYNDFAQFQKEGRGSGILGVELQRIDPAIYFDYPDGRWAEKHVLPDGQRLLHFNIGDDNDEFIDEFSRLRRMSHFAHKYCDLDEAEARCDPLVVWDYGSWKRLETQEDSQSEEPKSNDSDEVDFESEKRVRFWKQLLGSENAHRAIRVKREHLSDAFWDLREGSDERHSWTRWLIARLLFIGYSLHVVVALQGLWYVICYSLSL